MSHFTTPFIVINLGCEMVYIVEQRLKMQNIASDKSEKVLTDIVTVLLHPKLLDELFIPQPIAPHDVIKQLLSDIAASSIMRLDDYSINKLWDLMTMIFKWQVAVATNQNIFDITRRHIKCVASLMPSNFPKYLFENVYTKLAALATKLTDNDYKGLANTLILWLAKYHSKISVLLRLGLQRKDGTFCLPSTIPMKFLKYLGENIYKYDNKKKSIDDYEVRCADEIRCLLGPIEISSTNHYEGTIKHDYQKFLKVPQGKKVFFKIIDTYRKNTVSNDLTFTADVPKSTQEDLLEMLEKTSLN